MLGLRIFTHSVRLVFTNLDAAFRVSGALYLVYAVIQGWFMYRFGDVMATMRPDAIANMPMSDSANGTFASAIMVSTVVTLMTTLWIAVAWHRFVLIGEQPKSWMPVWQGGRVLGYLGRSLLIAILAVLGGGIAGVVIGVIQMNSLIPLVGMAVGSYIFYRLSPILPAGALDKPIKLGDAWKASKGQTGTLISLAAITVVASTILEIPTMMNNDPSSIISIIYSLVVGWFAMLFGVSVITTLYGHFIEGRDVD